MPRLTPLLAAVLFLVALALGQEPSTLPSMGPAPTPKDLSSPKAAAQTFYRAIATGDAPTARSATIGTDQQLRLIDAACALSHGIQILRDAMVQKFGQFELGLGSGVPSLLEFPPVQEMDVHLDGDTATLTDPKSKRTIQARKVAGEWRVAIDSTAGQKRADDSASAALALGRLAEDVAAEIRQGKYPSAEAARQAFQDRMANVVLNFHPTTAPASRPTSEEP